MTENWNEHKRIYKERKKKLARAKFYRIFNKEKARDIQKEIHEEIEEDKIRQIMRTRHKILEGRKYADKIAERKRSISGTTDDVDALREKYKDTDWVDGESILLSRNEIIAFWKKEYGIGPEEAEDILKEFELAGADYDRKPITQFLARLLLFFDFENYDIQRLKMCKFSRDELIAGGMTTAYFNKSDTTIQALNMNYDCVEKCKKELKAALEYNKTAEDFAREVVKETREKMADLEKTMKELVAEFKKS